MEDTYINNVKETINKVLEYMHTLQSNIESEYKKNRKEIEMHLKEIEKLKLLIEEDKFDKQNFNNVSIIKSKDKTIKEQQNTIDRMQKELDKYKKTAKQTATIHEDENRTMYVEPTQNDNKNNSDDGNDTDYPVEEDTQTIKIKKKPAKPHIEKANNEKSSKKKEVVIEKKEDTEPEQDDEEEADDKKNISVKNTGKKITNTEADADDETTEDEKEKSEDNAETDEEEEPPPKVRNYEEKDYSVQEIKNKKKEMMKTYINKKTKIIYEYIDDMTIGGAIGKVENKKPVFY